MKVKYLYTILFLAGCSVVKDTDKKLSILNKNDPKAVASFCQSFYPCTVKKIDTIYFDTAFYIDRIDTVFYKDVVVDTFIKNCPSKIKIKYKDRIINIKKEIVNYIDDSSKIFLLKNDKKRLEENIVELQKKSGNLTLLLSFLGIIIIGLIYMLSKKKNENTASK